MSTELLDKHIKSRQAKRTLKHAFEWPVPLSLSDEELAELRLVKGVALTEGDVKDGTVTYTKDNVLFAAGGMAASAKLGLAVIDIDHFEDELPQEYVEKYGEAINDPYPPAIILDAQAVENTMPDGSTKMQVEYIASVANPLVYEMIGDGRIKGNSVVDYFRKENCDSCNTESCVCEVEGSSFLMNTFILDAVPNSNGTWVAQVTKNDIGTILTEDKDLDIEIVNARLNSLREVIQHGKKKKPKRKHDLEDYMTDGIWNDGEQSVKSYLETEKELDEATASAMATYLFKNPNILSQYQLELLSKDDLEAWWSALQGMMTEIAEMKRKLALKQFVLKSFANKEAREADQKLNKFTPYTQSEINYGKREEGTNCGSCRWMMAMDDEETVGMCAIGPESIEHDMGCDMHDLLPDLAAETPTENQPTEVEPDEDGNCPEGYEKNEDGTMCVEVDRDEDDPEGMPEQSPVPKQSLSRPKPTAVLETKPVKQQKRTNEILDAQIRELETKKELLSAQLKTMSPFHKRSQQPFDELEVVTAKIAELQTIKKK